MQYFGQFNIPIHRCVKHVIFRQTIRKLPTFYVSLLLHKFSDQLTIYRNSNPKDKEISQGQQLLRQNNIAGQNKLMVTGTKTKKEFLARICIQIFFSQGFQRRSQIFQMGNLFVHSYGVCVRGSPGNKSCRL